MKCTIKIIVGSLIAALLFFSCNPYKRILHDKNRTPAEKDLLKYPCGEEFPCKEKPPVIIESGIDSMEYYLALQAYYDALDNYGIAKDSIINLLSVIKAGEAGYVTNEEIVRDLLKATREKDSTRIVNNFLRNLNLPPKIKYRDIIVYQIDSLPLYALQRKLSACQLSEETLQKKVDNSSNWKLYFWIAIGVFILLVILLVRYLINKKAKQV